MPDLPETIHLRATPTHDQRVLAVGLAAVLAVATWPLFEYVEWFVAAIAGLTASALLIWALLAIPKTFTLTAKGVGRHVWGRDLALAVHPSGYARVRRRGRATWFYEFGGEVRRWLGLRVPPPGMTLAFGRSDADPTTTRRTLRAWRDRAAPAPGTSARPCLGCGYDLTGLPAGPPPRCPECGNRFPGPTVFGQAGIGNVSDRRLPAALGRAVTFNTIKSAVQPVFWMWMGWALLLDPEQKFPLTRALVVVIESAMRYGGFLSDRLSAVGLPNPPLLLSLAGVDPRPDLALAAVGRNVRRPNGGAGRRRDVAPPRTASGGPAACHSAAGSTSPRPGGTGRGRGCCGSGGCGGGGGGAGAFWFTFDATAAEARRLRGALLGEQDPQGVDRAGDAAEDRQDHVDPEVRPDPTVQRDRDRR